MRRLASSDVDALRTLAAASEAEGFRFLARFVRELADGTVTLGERQDYFLGVFDHGELLAVGGVTPDPYTDRRDTGRIRHVYVAPSFRRTGIGRMLMAALEEHACSSYAVLRLRTDTAAAAQFYEALGYERTSEPNATHRRRFSPRLGG